MLSVKDGATGSGVFTATGLGAGTVRVRVPRCGADMYWTTYSGCWIIWMLFTWPEATAKLTAPSVGSVSVAAHTVPLSVQGIACDGGGWDWAVMRADGFPDGQPLALVSFSSKLRVYCVVSWAWSMAASTLLQTAPPGSVWDWIWRCCTQAVPGGCGQDGTGEPFPVSTGGELASTLSLKVWAKTWLSKPEPAKRESTSWTDRVAGASPLPAVAPRARDEL